jgi:putative hemolysin|tara:strand:- start:1662 stop:2465 length:804 start_codon:yes stop_codon:yes gene_type:complete
MNSNEITEQFADVRTHVPFLAKHEGVARVLEELLCYPKIRKAFADSAQEKNPFAGVVMRLGLKFRMEEFAGKIPETGPVVVVANHGFGGSDALAMMAAMCDLRRDFRILANREVMLLDGMAPATFPVTLLNAGETKENTRSLRAMLKHVRQGGSLGVFPAGKVAYWQGDRMKDPPWNDHVVKLLQRMDATIIPLWFYGSPPPLINFLSRLSPFVRTALIPTGLAKMKGQEIVARAGEPVSGKELRAMGDEAGPWFRRRLESLAELGN